MLGVKSLLTKSDSKPQPASEEISAFLGKETVFEGKMTFQGMFRMEGRFEGEFFESGNLIVGETAVVKGKIGVNNLIIYGLVDGEINVKGRVEIHSTGKLHGNLVTPILIIEEGGILEGSCKMERKPDKEDEFHLISPKVDQL